MNYLRSIYDFKKTLPKYRGGGLSDYTRGNFGKNNNKVSLTAPQPFSKMSSGLGLAAMAAAPILDETGKKKEQDIYGNEYVKQDEGTSILDSALSGAAMGSNIDIMTGGATMGLGTAVGAIAGAGYGWYKSATGNREIDDQINKARERHSEESKAEGVNNYNLAKASGFNDSGNRYASMFKRGGYLKKYPEGGLINDNEGYRQSNIANFTNKKVINSNYIDTNNMSVPAIMANGKKLYNNTGTHYIKGKNVTEYPVFQGGGKIKPKLDTSNWEQSSLDSLSLYNKSRQYQTNIEKGYDDYYKDSYPTYNKDFINVAYNNKKLPSRKLVLLKEYPKLREDNKNYSIDEEIDEFKRFGYGKGLDEIIHTNLQNLKNLQNDKIKPYKIFVQAESPDYPIYKKPVGVQKKVEQPVIPTDTTTVVPQSVVPEQTKPKYTSEKKFYQGYKELINPTGLRPDYYHPEQVDSARVAKTAEWDNRNKKNLKTGNSLATTKFKMGGEINVDDKELNRLKKLGYKFDIL